MRVICQIRRVTLTGSPYHASSWAYIVVRIVGLTDGIIGQQIERAVKLRAAGLGCARSYMLRYCVPLLALLFAASLKSDRGFSL
jgi:hypothetical protein